MMTIISLLLLASLLPHLTSTVDVGIVNGWEAKPHSRPYMVSLQLNGRHICGGSLISNQWVLTAAHCWKGNVILTVVVGAHDLSNSKSLDRISVKKYIPHPDYKSLRNDIMLLMVTNSAHITCSDNIRSGNSTKKVRLNKNVGLISLPKYSKDINVDTLCSVAGWGRLWINGLLSNRLMEANVTILNHEECKRKWGSSYSALKMICVHGGGGSCKGDSGGPLVCGDTAAGVTSFGYSKLCNSAERPNVYTKISAYLPWIHQIIRNVK
ncbi:duodenase-1-like [Carassius gibelio]|uniref:duodenase-1-like n=1 Tax=Carassius gibelio TaxID=101364 RepID=UPI002278A805|nr:duodenase-1-like [Carassius gibelio]